MKNRSEKIHHLGTGYEPHVDEADGKLIYSLPVDSSFVTLSFSFEIHWRDLEILKSDSYRYVALHLILHRLLQNTFGPHLAQNGIEPARFTQNQFRNVVDDILHTDGTKLKNYVQKFSKDQNLALEIQITSHLDRRK